MLRQILNLAWKEILQLRRDRFLILFLIIAPTLQLALLSRNTGQGVKDLEVAVLDLDQTTLSRELITTLDNTEELHVSRFPAERTALYASLDSGQVQVGIIVPPGFSRSFFGQLPHPAQLQAIIDGTNIVVGSNGGQAVAGVISQLARRHFASKTPVDLGGIEVEASALFNPTYNTRWFVIPAQLAFITYQVALVIAATGFVREKELGTLEQLVITPIRRLELIVGKALPAILLGVFNFLVLLGVQTFVYHIPMRGDPWLLLGFASVFVVAIVGMGTVISVVAQNQQQAVLIVFLLAILEFTVSGLLVSVDNMPLIMRGLAQVSALQHFMVVMRAITLRGADLSMLLPHGLAIMAFAFVTAGVAWRTFTHSV